MKDFSLSLVMISALPLLMSFTEILSTNKYTHDIKAGGEFNLTVYKKRFRLTRDEPLIFANHMTDIRASLVLAEPQDFKKYGVVQFIKGCKWRSIWDGETLSKELSIARDHLNQRVIFKHSAFEVDTVDLDPMYSAYEGHRFALWRWNDDSRNDDPETATYVFHKEPPHGTVFLTDMPGTSFRSEAVYNDIITAQNSTLEFKTCLFRLEDIPLETDARGSNIAQEKAIVCHSWEDKWIYDFETEKMTTPKHIDPVCL